MWGYFPQKWYEVPGFLWRAWTVGRPDPAPVRPRPTATPPRVTETPRPARSTAVSSDWVLNQLAGHRFPGQGEAYDYMKKCLEKST